MVYKEKKTTREIFDRFKKQSQENWESFELDYQANKAYDEFERCFGIGCYAKDERIAP